MALGQAAAVGLPVAQLKIETEKMAEAKRQNDRLIDQTTKRITEVERTIAMLKQSDIV